MNDLSFSIDLEAELRSMTERQHLNAVHFAVQLVRHALRHRPRKIRISSSRSRFTIEHDGNALADEEMRLFFDVMRQQDSNERRQQALAELERTWGIDVLSLLLRQPRVRLESRTSLETKDGVLSSDPTRRERGVRIVVWRRRTSAKQERRELLFYAQHADAEIRFNRRKLNRPLKLDNAFLFVGIQEDAGSGALGLAKAGELKRIRFFKDGVYFGVRSTVPADGLVTEGFFNTQDSIVEDNFQASVRRSSTSLRQARDELLTRIATDFDQLSRKRQRRAKHLLLRIHAGVWTPELLALPLFDAAGGKRAYSVNQLARKSARAVLFYAPKGGRGPTDPHLPFLDEEEAVALQHLLGVSVRPALEPKKRRTLLESFFGRREAASLRFPTHAAPAFVAHELRNLAAAVYVPGVFSLRWCDEVGIDVAINGTQVRLSPTHPDVSAIAAGVARDASVCPAARIRLEAIATAS